MPSELIKLQDVRCVLLDIEGTVSDVRFVYEVMFPYARNHMGRFLVENWKTESVRSALQQVAVDAQRTLADWLGDHWADGGQETHQVCIAHLEQLMDGDSKSTGLKALQGLVWKAGFESGEIRAELFSEVSQILKTWKDAGLDLRIYSSGSILAQRLFFGHTTDGDLLPLLSGFYDTTFGKKQEVESYRKIATDIHFPANQILFLSDVAEEINAASQAGMQAIAVVRPSNKPLPAHFDGIKIESLNQLILA